MSSAIFIESSAAAADSLLCEECIGETATETGFWVGFSAIERHAEQHPDHQFVTWLQAEVI